MFYYYYDATYILVDYRSAVKYVWQLRRMSTVPIARYAQCAQHESGMTGKRCSRANPACKLGFMT